MKKIIKYLSFSLIVLALSATMSACSIMGETEGIKYDSAAVTQTASNTIDLIQTAYSDPEITKNVLAYNEEELADLSETLKNSGLRINGDAFISGFQSYLSTAESVGDMQMTGEPVDIKSDEKEIIVDLVMQGEKKPVDVEVLMTKSNTVTSIAFNERKTLGEKMENAGLNTLLGMGTTFCVLILISVVITLMSAATRALTGKK